MNQYYSMDQVMKRLVLVGVILLGTHLFIDLYLSIGSPKPTTFSRLYKRYLLPGPFFSERHIQISPHLFLAYKHGGRWTTLTDYGINNFSAFLESPWRYGKLKESDYLRHITRLMYNKIGDRSFEDYKDDREFKELNSYVQGELLGDRADSIQLVYVFKTYAAETHQVKIDTVLNVKYNPSEIDASR